MLCSPRSMLRTLNGVHVRRIATSAARFNGILSSAYIPSSVYPWVNGKPLTVNQCVDWIPITNPATGKQISRLAHPTPAQLDSALESAESASLLTRAGTVGGDGGWASAQERATVLRRLAALLREHTPRLAEIEVAQTGRCIREMKAQLARVNEWCDYYASMISVEGASLRPVRGKQINIVERLPLGVVLQVTPYNHPLLIAIKKIAPALAAGNAVLVKASEVAPLTVLAFSELAKEAGVPDGMLHILPGRGEEICTHLLNDPRQRVRKVDLTGGTKAGYALGALTGRNLIPYTAELGGKAPILVAEDADLRSAVIGAAFAAFIASGQTCVTGSRAIVHEGIFRPFVDALVAKARSITEQIGDPSDPLVSLGSLISKAHMNKVHNIVDRAVKSDIWQLAAGGQPLQGMATSRACQTGFDLSNGAFYPPTVLVPKAGVSSEVYTASEIWNEEVFGPVLLVVPAESDADLVGKANGSKYALGASVWTESIWRAHELMTKVGAGVMWCNTHHRNDPSSPWGPMPAGEGSRSSASGMGTENGPEAYHAYTVCRSRTISLQSPSARVEQEDWFSEKALSKGVRYG